MGYLCVFGGFGGVFEAGVDSRSEGGREIEARGGIEREREGGI